jgi:dipeptidyl aminopeptidase/acylaminoacyl peptidase
MLKVAARGSIQHSPFNIEHSTFAFEHFPLQHSPFFHGAGLHGHRDMLCFSFMRRLSITLLLLLAVPAFAQETYQLPSKEIVELADAPPTPLLYTGPTDWALLYQTPALLAIADLAQPELKLAGQRFNPQTHEQTRAGYAIDLRLLNVTTGVEKKLSGLPSPLRARNVAWSPDGARVAFTHASERGVELWVVDAASGAASRVGNALINATLPSRPIQWLSDSRTILAKLVPANWGDAPADTRVPRGPVIQETLGKRSPGRTYQDLLQNPYDEALFEHHVQSQLALVTLDGNVTNVGPRGMYAQAQASPDAQWLFVDTLHRPFSYVVPEGRFPRLLEVWSRDGRVVRQIADLPLADAVPTDFDATSEGVRDADWRADAPATLVWVEALDKGNARAEAAERDKVLMLAAPFEGSPATLATLGMRFDGITWGDDDLALVREGWWKTRRTRTWRVRPGKPSQAAELVWDRSSEDRYGDPGFPITKPTPRGTEVIRLSPDKKAFYLVGGGASAEGDRPFLDRFEVATKKTARLFRSEAPYYEAVYDVLDDRASRIVTRRETSAEPPQYVLRDLVRRIAPKQLTSFAHPSPQLAQAKKELIRYQRADGVKLTATLYTPPGYDPARDGRLPVLVWAYPEEFKSADAASQVSGSPHRFIRVSPMSPLPWLVRGYAILDNPSFPIIGEGDKEPNDTYIDQHVAGAKAAVDEVVRRGVGDRDRFAVGGHSYGAFMTANLLAHSDLFRAGIARSGAYNRTLTPFSFQAEERTFWEAPETYIQMSPFTHAQKINEPLLMLHGIDDNNTGTFPIQSERLYQAMRGLGGTVRLVMLPYESHGYRARESVLHMIWEMDRWMEAYVKAPRAAAAAK